MAKDKISVIIPTIGRMDKLENVLKGIFGGKNAKKIDPEVLLVFDGEKSEEFLKFEKEFSHKKVKFLEAEKKSGAATARNIGIENAAGDILVFIGDDTIPTEDWLDQIYTFHQKHPQENIGMLGKVSWVAGLAQDHFHQWIENYPQFDFKNIKKNGADWRHFYTSNVSVKRSFVGHEKFPEAFSGWGFEDSEFGYRLHKNGLKLVFNEKCKVLHDHPQSLEEVIRHTKNSRENAKIFESLHPEIKILPRGMKLFKLRIAILGATVVSPISPEMYWWKEWKKAWVGQ